MPPLQGAWVWPLVGKLRSHMPHEGGGGNLKQSRRLEWVAISSSRGSSQPRDQTCVSSISCTDRWILYRYATWEVLKSTRTHYFQKDSILAFTNANTPICISTSPLKKGNNYRLRETNNIIKVFWLFPWDYLFRIILSAWTFHGKQNMHRSLLYFLATRSMQS